MDRNAITTAVLLFLIVADVSIASPFWKLRFLADESPTKNGTTAATPPSPTKKLDPKPDGQSKLDPNPLNKTDSANQSPVAKKDPKLSNKLGKVIPPPPQKGIESGTGNSRNDKTVEDNEEKKINASSGNNSSSTSTSDKTSEGKEEKKKNTDSGKKPNSTGTGQADVSKEDENKKPPTKTVEDGNETRSGIVETCNGVAGADSCNDGNYLTACIKGSKQRVVLVHNSGGKSLKVKVAGPSGESIVEGLKVPKHGTQKIDIPSTTSETGELLLSAGSGDCVLHMNLPVSEGDPFLKLPSYDKLLTPVNGAYFLIAAALVFGGLWACCMFRKKRQHDSIPYQELEMGLPDSMAATEVETAEGWDQGWDSDWDEDKAVKSPMGRRNVPNISANGLTSRSSNRDGWENDWDD